MEAHRPALRDYSRKNKVAAVLVRRGPVFAFDVVCVFVVVVSIATFFCPSLSHRPLPSFHAPLQLAPATRSPDYSQSVRARPCAVALL